MSTMYRLVFAANLVLASNAVLAATSFDANAQFDTGSNPSQSNGWSYGYSNSLDGSFTLLSAKYTINSQFQGWQYANSVYYPDITKNTSASDYINTPAKGFIPKGALTFAGGQGISAGLLPIIRWSAVQSGTYSLNAVFTGVWDHEDSSGMVNILKNGVSIFDEAINRQSTSSFTGNVTLAIGDHLDFSVKADGSNLWVRSIIAAHVSPVPEPSTSILLLVGLVSIAGVYSRLRMSGSR